MPMAIKSICLLNFSPFILAHVSSDNEKHNFTSAIWGFYHEHSICIINSIFHPTEVAHKRFYFFEFSFTFGETNRKWHFLSVSKIVRCQPWTIFSTSTPNIEGWMPRASHSFRYLQIFSEQIDTSSMVFDHIYDVRTQIFIFPAHITSLLNVVNVYLVQLIWSSPSPIGLNNFQAKTK